MEMEINFINYKFFTEVYLKIKVRGRKISYHFLVDGKPRERIDLLITSSLNIWKFARQKKEKKKYSNSNENIFLKENWRKNLKPSF